MQKTLIAMVALAVVIDGTRQTIQPGESVQDLSPHDERELLESGAIQDVEAADSEKRSDARAESAALADFKKARKRVQEEIASTAKPADPPAE